MRSQHRPTKKRAQLRFLVNLHTKDAEERVTFLQQEDHSNDSRLRGENIALFLQDVLSSRYPGGLGSWHAAVLQLTDSPKHSADGYVEILDRLRRQIIVFSKFAKQNAKKSSKELLEAFRVVNNQQRDKTAIQLIDVRELAKQKEDSGSGKLPGLEEILAVELQAARETPPTDPKAFVDGFNEKLGIRYAIQLPDGRLARLATTSPKTKTHIEFKVIGGGLSGGFPLASSRRIRRIEPSHLPVVAIRRVAHGQFVRI